MRCKFCVRLFLETKIKSHEAMCIKKVGCRFCKKLFTQSELKIHEQECGIMWVEERHCIFCDKWFFKSVQGFDLKTHKKVCKMLWKKRLLQKTCHEISPHKPNSPESQSASRQQATTPMPAGQIMSFEQHGSSEKCKVCLKWISKGMIQRHEAACHKRSVACKWCQVCFPNSELQGHERSCKTCHYRILEMGVHKMELPVHPSSKQFNGINKVVLPSHQSLVIKNKQFTGIESHSIAFARLITEGTKITNIQTNSQEPFVESMMKQTTHVNKCKICKICGSSVESSLIKVHEQCCLKTYQERISMTCNSPSGGDCTEIVAISSHIPSDCKVEDSSINTGLPFSDTNKSECDEKPADSDLSNREIIQPKKECLTCKGWFNEGQSQCQICKLWNIPHQEEPVNTLRQPVTSTENVLVISPEIPGAMAPGNKVPEGPDKCEKTEIKNEAQVNDSKLFEDENKSDNLIKSEHNTDELCLKGDILLDEPDIESDNPKQNSCELEKYFLGSY